MLLTIGQRACDLDPSYSGKHSEDKDGNEKRRLKIGLRGIALTAEEMNCLFGEAHAYRALFNINGKNVTPILRGIKAIEIDGAWEGAYVVVFYELGASKIVFDSAKLTKIRIELEDEDGNIGPFLNVDVSGEPTYDQSLAELLDRCGHGIECELRAQPPSSQEELPLNQHGEGEEPDEPTSRRRRRAGDRRPSTH